MEAARGSELGRSVGRSACSVTVRPPGKFGRFGSALLVRPLQSVRFGNSGARRPRPMGTGAAGRRSQGRVGSARPYLAGATQGLARTRDSPPPPPPRVPLMSGLGMCPDRGSGRESLDLTSPSAPPHKQAQGHMWGRTALRGSQGPSCERERAERVCCSACLVIDPCTCTRWEPTMRQALSQVLGPRREQVLQLWAHCLVAHTPI